MKGALSLIFSTTALFDCGPLFLGGLCRLIRILSFGHALVCAIVVVGFLVWRFVIGGGLHVTKVILSRLMSC